MEKVKRIKKSPVDKEKFSYFKIREPFWKFKAVGLAESKMLKDDLAVEITYKDKSGQRAYPGIMCIKKNIAMLCLRHEVKGRGVFLRIVPIEKLVQMSHSKG